MVDDATILFVGALTLDTMYRLPKMPEAKGKYLATERKEVAAGMASSAAISCARLGGRPALLASVGDDPVADRLVDSLTDAGVNCDLVRRLPAVPSAGATILVDDEGERIVVVHYDKALGAPLDESRLARLADFRACMVDSRWPDAARSALRAVRRNGGPAIYDLDVGPADDLRAVLAEATHVVASEAGARIAAETSDRVAALQRLSAACGGFAAITLGEEGCLWVDGPGCRATLSRPPEVEVIDTNAAGDVFHGAFALAVLEGAGNMEAVDFANHAAALKCTRFGGPSGAPDRAEVTAFMNTGAVPNGRNEPA